MGRRRRRRENSRAESEGPSRPSLGLPRTVVLPRPRRPHAGNGSPPHAEVMCPHGIVLFSIAGETSGTKMVCEVFQHAVRIAKSRVGMLATDSEPGWCGSRFRFD